MSGIRFKSRFVNLSGIDPAEAAETLETLREQNAGKLYPIKLVEASRDKESLFHGCFEWDNARAGSRYREWQARNIIRSVRITKPDRDGTPIESSAYVSVQIVRLADDGAIVRDTFYQSIDVAVKHVDQWASAIELFSQKINDMKHSLHELERIAAGNEDADRLSRIAIAIRAVDTARLALAH